MTLYQAYKSSALKVLNETALYYFKTKISFKKLLNSIDELAASLQNDYHIEKGDVILVSLPNIPQTIILFYAINKIGAVSNMVHPNSPFDVMQKYYKDANCKLAFLFDERVYRQLNEYKNFDGNIILCSAKTYLDPNRKSIYAFMKRKVYKALYKDNNFGNYNNLRKSDEESKEIVLNSNETSVLLHSASTTGISKTICLNTQSFNFTVSRASEIMCMKEEDFVGKSMISILPSFHGFGLCMSMHLPLANCFGAVLIPKFSVKSVVSALKQWKNVILINGVPNVYKALVNDNSFVNCKYIKNLMNCYSGGDSLNPIIKEYFDSIMIRHKSSCRLYEGYGLTEALSVCTVNTRRHHKKGSIGYPISGVSIKILDDNNNELEPGIVGEIAIKSGSNMLGYYKDEEATKATYYGEYLKTGDLGHLDEDGFLYFSSRRKRVIKVSGVAVFPHEIENVIRSIEGVKSACVVQIPDENTINAAKAYVVSKDKDPNRIIEECRKRLISWSIPKEVEFVDKLPMTKLNKVDFVRVQELEDAKRKA